MRKTVWFAIFTVVGAGLWAQASWQGLGVDFDDPPRQLWVDRIDGRLYAVGFMEAMNGQPIDGIAYYDGHDWERLPPGNAVKHIGAINRFDGRLLIAGYEGLSAWDGIAWRNFFPECSLGEIVALGGEFFVMGVFRGIPGDSIVGMAVLKDSVLVDSFRFGETMPYVQGISALTMYQGKLVASGQIEQGNMKEVMQWVGNGWSSLGTGLGGGGSVWINDMEVYHGNLYVAGHFDELQGCPGYNIARWDGTSWHRVGEGLGYYGQVFDLMQHDGRLYAVGSFSDVSGMPSIGFATWDGTQWCTVGAEIDNALLDMAVYRDEIYIAGGFKTIGGDSIRYVAKWVGGSYVDDCRAYPVEPEPPQPVDGEVHLVPNPATDDVWLLGSDSLIVADVSVTDMQGRLVLRKSAVAVEERIDVSHFAAGVYVVRVWVSGKVQNVKLVVN